MVLAKQSTDTIGWLPSLPYRVRGVIRGLGPRPRFCSSPAQLHASSSVSMPSRGAVAAMRTLGLVLTATVVAASDEMPFKLLGCVKDVSLSEDHYPFEIPGPSYTDGVRMSTEGCYAFCRSKDAPYFGLWNGETCQCADELHWKAWEHERWSGTCDSPCPVRQCKNCGGSDSWSVYKVDMAKPLEDKYLDYMSPVDHYPGFPVYEHERPGAGYTNPNSVEHKGCYEGKPLLQMKAHGTGKRGEKDEAFLTDKFMTPWKCYMHCKDSGYKNYGLSGKDCTCGYLDDRSEQARGNYNCNKPCPGDEDFACGGGSGLAAFTSVYEIPMRKEPALFDLGMSRYYVFRGCYMTPHARELSEAHDASSRKLSSTKHPTEKYMKITEPTMTIKRCRDFCMHDNNYWWFALSGGNTCECGKEKHELILWSLDLSQCDEPCASEAFLEKQTESCGGWEAGSVYKKWTPPPPKPENLRGPEPEKLVEELSAQEALERYTAPDDCPDDPKKAKPGKCGCGMPETEPCVDYGAGAGGMEEAVMEAIDKREVKEVEEDDEWIFPNDDLPFASEPEDKAIITRMTTSPKNSNKSSITGRESSGASSALSAARVPLLVAATIVPVLAALL